MTDSVAKNQHRSLADFFPVLCVVLFFACTLFCTAWLSDDAYISFRAARNLVEGNGFSYNVGERVQTFTNPLWTLLIAGVYTFTREVYYTGIFLGFFLSLATVAFVGLVFWRGWRESMLAVLILAISKAFVDYSTSGLENPLSNLLLVLFVFVFLRRAGDTKQALWLSLLASLACVNRLDNLFILVPALIYVFLTKRDYRQIKMMLIGSLPLLLWEVFAIIYYGFPYPNSACAKLNNGVSNWALAQRGFCYLFDSLSNDPITLSVTFLGLFAPMFFKRRDLIPLSLGGLLHLSYVVKIGGDFMSGRFLCLSLLLGVILIMESWISRYLIAWCCGVIVVLGVYGYNALHSTIPPGMSQKKFAIRRFGIADERIHYYYDTGLLRRYPEFGPPNNDLARSARIASQGSQKTQWAPPLGIYGYYAGSRLRIYDPLALADPFLARIPPMKGLNWRVGHFVRRIPKGYKETLETGVNQIADPRLAQLYEYIRVITTGKLFSSKRWVEIWRVNRGVYADLVDRESYERPEPTRLTIWSRDQCLYPLKAWKYKKLFSAEGAFLKIPRVSHADRTELFIDLNGDFSLILLKDGKELATVPVQKTSSIEHVLAFARADIPKPVAQEGFNEIRIFPKDPSQVYAVSGIHLENSGIEKDLTP